MSIIINSTDNQRIKALNKLKLKKHRNEQFSFLIEGEKILHEALERNLLSDYYQIKEIYISESFSFDTLENHHKLDSIPIFQVSEKVFAHISNVQAPQGCLAVVQKANIDWDPIFQLHQKRFGNQQQLVFLLDGIQDPGNVGTIIRIADAVGATAVVIGKGTADVFSDKVIRAAMGSIFHVPIIEEDLIHTIEALKEHSYQIMAADLQGTPYYELHSKGNIAIVMGNEGSGVSTLVKDCVDSYLSIPMPGFSESLNVSVATGIIAFDLVRQRDLQNNS